MPTLTGPRAAPRSGQTKSLVILVRGDGADGHDLFGLSGPFAERLPETAFRSPNGPERCRANPSAYQWFPISWLDGSPESEMEAGFRRSAAILDRYITEAMAEEGVGPAATALVGFSQGTMMSLHVAPRRAEALAAIVGFSGRLQDGGKLSREAVSKPPVLLIHGDQDEMIPVAALDEAGDGPGDAGSRGQRHSSRGVGHGIAADGLGVEEDFLEENVGISTE